MVVQYWYLLLTVIVSVAVIFGYEIWDFVATILFLRRLSKEAK